MIRTDWEDFTNWVRQAREMGAVSVEVSGRAWQLLMAAEILRPSSPGRWPYIAGAAQHECWEGMRLRFSDFCEPPIRFCWWRDPLIFGASA